LLKPKGVATAPAKKKMKGKNEINWILHVVAAFTTVLAAVYFFTDAPSSGDAKQTSPRSNKRKTEIVYEEMPSYEETHQDIRTMVKWVESNGGSLDERIAIRDGEHNRGMYLYAGSMTRTERANVRFMEIPESLFLSTKSLLIPKSSFGNIVKDQDLINDLIKEADQTQLAVMVMAESNNPNSFWRPFLNTLKKSEILKSGNIGSPVLWTDEQLQEIQSPLLLESIQANIAYIKQKLPLVEAIAERYPNLFPDNSNLAGDFTWFMCLVNSRSFALSDGPGSEKVVNAMVPLLDLPNHNFIEPNIIVDMYESHYEKEVDGEEDGEESKTSKTVFTSMVPASLKKIPHGGELLVSYGVNTQAYYLEKYGMVDDDYENRTMVDYVSLKLPGINFRVLDDGTFDFATAQFSIKHTTQHELTANELLQKVQETLERLPTTLDQDKELLNSPNDEGTVLVPRNALLVRIRFKQVLHNMMRFLEAGAPTPPITKSLKTKGALFELDFSETFVSEHKLLYEDEGFGEEEDVKQ